ncbi:2-hydroxyacid dehydrogenase [Kushneria phosphatilytica]|uniref:D-glycerate dehydrogenase n=1 Tax=Kushneria phosphatilytica TaxID=657387 RepID=A0A1S1NXZ4_9GAMM|nr:D-glycerate dehydrogenase [Kushneria phosphatilytica]OHV12307.1 bifunctional glyoxylate/hydroxypyruvate reductase B [Kushneria phosphatilytica]QEL11513.1 D-glycerate dehydrogenase [Kushneria phosphatilytica]
MSRKTVLVYQRPLKPALHERLTQECEVLDFTDRKDLHNDADFREALKRAHGLIGSSVPMDRNLLAEAENLEVISSISVGVDNYDIDYLTERGIVLCHTPDVLTETTADTAFLLVLATARRGVELANMVRNGEWTSSIAEPHFGVDVQGKHLGIVGMGRIGAAIGRRGRFGFNMTVSYHNRSRHEDFEQELGASWRELDDLLRECDFIVVTVPLSEATREMFGKREFELMGDQAIFINIARGGVVDEPALIEALKNGTIRAAGLDVFTTEPLPGDSPLARMDNVVALPHIGSATHETRYAMAELAVNNLLAALADQKPQAPYNWEQLKR